MPLFLLIEKRELLVIVQKETSSRNKSGRTSKITLLSKNAAEELLGVIHFWSSRRFDLLELWESAKARWLGFASAAARGGEKRENRSDKCGKNTDHGDCGAGFENDIPEPKSIRE